MISVVIPAFNEADVVGEAVRHVEEALGQVKHETVVFVVARRSHRKI